MEFNELVESLSDYERSKDLRVAEKYDELLSELVTHVSKCASWGHTNHIFEIPIGLNKNRKEVVSDIRKLLPDKKIVILGWWFSDLFSLMNERIVYISWHPRNKTKWGRFITSLKRYVER